jgi:hypothetical protein
MHHRNPLRRSRSVAGSFFICLRSWAEPIGFRLCREKLRDPREQTSNVGIMTERSGRSAARLRAADQPVLAIENGLRKQPMRMRAVWLLGLLTSVILGSLLGLSLWHAGLGSAAWGVAAGALTFACFSPWPSVANTSIGTDPSSYFSSDVAAPPPSNALSLGKP